MEAQPRGVMVCPRCGAPVSYIERQRRGNRVYYYAVHYEGYERTPDGRVHKKVRRCYLGPNAYIEVSKLHADLGLTLNGLIEEGRERDYMEALARSVRDRIRSGRLTAEGARELAAALSRFSEELRELAKELSEYASGAAPRGAVNETVARPQPLEAPQVTTQAQLTPEDIDREVKRIQETVKGEFKRAQTTR